MSPLRILIADDHLLFRKGLAQLLATQPDFEIAGEAADGVSAVEQALRLQPDLILMDIRMPSCDGIEATRRIKTQMPEVRVVILTVSADESDLTAAAQCGADGYLLKDLAPETLFQQLRGLFDGRTPVAHSIMGKLFRQLGQSHSLMGPTVEGILSPRERQVLALVANGYSNQAIARELGIATNTVKNHMRNILDKLGAKNRAQAAAYAVSHGLARTGTDQKDRETHPARATTTGQ